MILNISRLTDEELRQLAQLPIADVAQAAQKEILRRRNDALSGLVAAAASKCVHEIRDIFNLSDTDYISISIKTINQTFVFNFGDAPARKHNKRWPGGDRQKTAQIIKEITNWPDDVVERKLRYGWRIFARGHPAVAARVAEAAKDSAI